MHGQHHDCAQQNKQRVGTDFDGFHYCSSPENDRLTQASTVLPFNTLFLLNIIQTPQH
jgi:hypothetical protein